MTALLEFLARIVAPAHGSGVFWPTGASVAGLVALAGLAGALGVVALVAAAALRSVAALAASLRVRTAWSRPLQPVAGWLLKSQADPDADGRPRPRAPGVPLPVV